MSEELSQQIKEMIVERCFLDLSPEEIEDDAPLMEEVGLDSVQILEVVVGLEELFGVTFEEADFDLENFSSVAAITQWVRGQLEQAQ
jgi:acyl carrier protein